jgi:hypothetical protein
VSKLFLSEYIASIHHRQRIKNRKLGQGTNQQGSKAQISKAARHLFLSVLTSKAGHKSSHKAARPHNSSDKLQVIIGKKSGQGKML